MSVTTILITLLTEDEGVLPTRIANKEYAIELYSPRDVIIEPEQREVLTMNMAVIFPKGFRGEIVLIPKYQSLYVNKLPLKEGLIPSLEIPIFNPSGANMMIAKGTKIAELINFSGEDVVVKRTERYRDENLGEEEMEIDY